MAHSAVLGVAVFVAGAGLIGLILVIVETFGVSRKFRRRRR